MNRGPCSRVAIDQAVLGEFLDYHTTYRVGGTPQRRRRYINGKRVKDPDSRTIRRWKAGVLGGATERAVRALLRRHDLTLADFKAYCAVRDIVPTTRGTLK